MGAQRERLHRRKKRHPEPTRLERSLASDDISSVAGERPWPATIQRTLTVGQAGDQYEREADRVADQVTETPQGGAGVARVVGRISPDAASPARDAGAQQDAGHLGMESAPTAVHDVLSKSGEPLAPEIRAEMEPRFGHDFSQVRVHTDSGAASSAQAIDAHAYTHGHHIVFGAGQFAPDTGAGSRLLAHELTHVVQQSSAAPAMDQVAEEGTTQRSLIVQRENGAATADEPATEEGTAEPPGAWTYDNAIQDYVEDSAEEWRHNKDRFDLALRQFQRRMSMTSESEIVPDVTGAVVAHVTKQITSAALSRVETLLPGWGEVKGVVDAMVGELERAAAAQQGLALRDFLMTTDDIMSEYFEQQIRAVRTGREDLREMLAGIDNPEIKQGMVDSFPNWLKAIQDRIPTDEQYEAALYIEWVNQAQGMLDGYNALGQIEIKFDADDPGKYEFESAKVRAPFPDNVASGINFIMNTDELGAPNILYLPIRKSVGLWCENIVGGKGYGWALMDENNNTIQEPVQPVAAERWWAMPWKPLEEITEVSG